MQRLSPFFLYFTILLLPLAGFQAYRSGLTAGFFFDDFPNLSGLAVVSDLNSALAFALEPRGGPLGRPLALFSFLLNVSSWDVAPEDFLFTNICIHLLNAMLLMWCCLRAARMVGDDHAQAGWFALSVAALWMVQPLIVSASLMIVQRMTTLAVTFGLIGSLLFLRGLELLKQSSRSGYWVMSLGVVLGTFFGVLTKENGALLPMLVLILQGTVLGRYVQDLGPGYRLWRLVFLVFPSLLIGTYLLYLLPTLPAAYEFRDFSFEQRVLTEARLVLRYLGLILFPRRADIGPFQDDYPLSNGLLDPPITLLCYLTIASLLALAVALRNKIAVFSFAVFWFFAGHLLESTIIPLEIYFEHRNYFPSVGPTVAIVYLALHRWPNRWVGPVTLAAYVSLVTWVCFSVASVIGDKRQSAILWAQEHPDSIRAVQNLTLVHSLNRDYAASAAVIQAYSDRHPQDVGAAMQSVQLACLTGTASSRLAHLRQRQGFFERGKLNGVICGAMEKIATLVIEDACPGFSSQDVFSVSRQILASHNIDRAREVSYCLHDAQAMLYFNERDFSATMEHLEAAFSFRTYLDVAERLIEIPISAGRYDLARESIAKVRARKPKNIFQAKMWEDKITKLEVLIDGIEKRDGHVLK